VNRDSIVVESILIGSVKAEAIKLNIEHLFEEARKEREELGQLLRETAYRSASTGINAHFKFDALPPRDYLLYASMLLGEEVHEWFVPVSVVAGSRIVKDLDNTTVSTKPKWPCDAGYQFE
jgi:hypothetical protein